MRVEALILAGVTAMVSVFSVQAGEETLKEAFKDKFYIGTAIKPGLISNKKQSSVQKLVVRQFNTISPENILKWQPFNPKPGKYKFEQADDYVKFGLQNKMYTVGHVLFWHNQTPEWVFEDEKGKPISREALLKRMREHVRLIAKRYGNRINAWDVVNESIEGSGKLRQSPWTKIIGDDFIEQAFRIAQEELPKDVELIYNDFSMTVKGKRNGVVKMVKDLKAKGIRIDGVGMQSHWAIGSPSIKEIEESIVAFANEGVKVHLSELDIDVLPRSSKVWSGDADIKLKLEQDPAMNPYQGGLPDEMQKKLADRYRDIFALFLKHSDKIRRVTFWGANDANTWLHNWPIKGRTSYPMLFDRDNKPKPAYHAVIKLATEKK